MLRTIPCMQFKDIKSVSTYLLAISQLRLCEITARSLIPSIHILLHAYSQRTQLCNFTWGIHKTKRLFIHLFIKLYSAPTSWEELQYLTFHSLRGVILDLSCVQVLFPWMLHHTDPFTCCFNPNWICLKEYLVNEWFCFKNYFFGQVYAALFFPLYA